MIALFVVVLIAGLLATVGVMFFGIERPGHTVHAASGGVSDSVPRVRISHAAVAASALVLGMVGYLLVRNGATGSFAFFVAAASGLAAAALAAWGASAWARVVPEHDIEDPRYVLQGHLARVTAPITADREGEITFEVGAERHTVRARMIDDSSVAVGAEVVIERIDDEVAYVEPWQQVEKRL